MNKNFTFRKMEQNEKAVIHHNFKDLVRDLHAKSLVDELVSAHVFDEDDSQRVLRQITDQDMSRTLLIILLKKKTQSVPVFSSFVKALHASGHKEIAQTITNPSTNSGISSNVDHTKVKEFHNSEGEDLADGGQRTDTVIPDAARGTDLAYCGLQDLTNDLSMTPAGLPIILSHVPSMIDKDSSESAMLDSLKLDVSAEDIKQVLNLTRGTSGQVSLGQRIFSYQTNGNYKNGELVWTVEVKDELTKYTVERSGTSSYTDLLEECLLTFVKK